MRAVSRLTPSLFALAFFSACVPTDDASTSAPKEQPRPPEGPAAQPTPAAPTPPPPSAMPIAPIPLPSGTRLDPNRPMPSANPFALADAAPRRPDGGAATRRLSIADQRRLDPAVREGARIEPRPGAQPPPPQDEPPPPPTPVVAAPAPTPSLAKPAADAKPAGPPDAPITAVYYDTFDRAELGAEWSATSPEWKVVGGRLCGRNAHNHPVWLNRKLPVNARIEFDAVSSSADGDLKVEIWGDGKSFAKGTSYTDATSYLAIFGGWKNQFHVLARIDEHAQGRPEVKVQPNGDYKARPVVANTIYHFKVERSDGKTVRWFIDDIEIIAFTDPAPLKGEGHEHLGFNDWEVQVCFDNLQISALPGA